jgi:hypothetical protein
MDAKFCLGGIGLAHREKIQKKKIPIRRKIIGRFSGSNYF